MARVAAGKKANEFAVRRAGASFFSRRQANAFLLPVRHVSKCKIAEFVVPPLAKYRKKV
jgi:hypothetical protein